MTLNNERNHSETWGLDDGSAEFVLGVAIVLLATVSLVTHDLSGASAGGKILAPWAQFLGAGSFLLLLTRGLKIVRDRVGIPQGGSAAVGRRSSVPFTAVMLGVLGIAVLIPILSGAIGAATVGREEPLFATLLLAGALVWGAFAFGPRRLLFPAILAVLAGAWARWSGLQFTGALWVLESAGAGLALSGASGLRSFRKSHVLPG